MCLHEHHLQAHDSLPKVTLVILNAIGLHDGQSFGNLDPYVKGIPVGWEPTGLLRGQTSWKKTLTLPAAGSNACWERGNEMSWYLPNERSALGASVGVEVWDEDDVVDCFIGGASVGLGSLDRTGVPSTVELRLTNRQGDDAGKLQVRVQLKL
eukprot:TRINITY_DN6396_c0_g1_i1.p1 TRINITY_DN6396_c0_g1~~TRINITY_DN6396_c0_g1_i1.p1  ORF type:complete len:153 (+),score=43.61 TRINITY_DN6396_c0_g1_i1:310-768(+)